MCTLPCGVRLKKTFVHSVLCALIFQNVGSQFCYRLLLLLGFFSDTNILIAPIIGFAVMHFDRQWSVSEKMLF